MSISPGYTDEEIRALVHEYGLVPHGGKSAWLVERGVSRRRMERWRSAVYDGDLARGLIPTEQGGAPGMPASARTALERARAREIAEHRAEVERLQRRIGELEAANDVLGKAIGLLHEMSGQEPGSTPATSAPSDSSRPRTHSSPS